MFNLIKITHEMYECDLNYCYFKIGKDSVRRTKKYIYHHYKDTLIFIVDIENKIFEISSNISNILNNKIENKIKWLEMFYKEKGYKSITEIKYF